MSTIPLPERDEIFRIVKSSCRQCRQRAGLTIDHESITTFLTTLNTQEDQWNQLSVNHSTKLPLKFDNLIQEVNLIALVQLLNFSSGYRVVLKRLTNRGAFDTIRALVISFHISQTDLSAKGLERVTIDGIANMAQLPVTEEIDHPDLEGVQIGQRTKLAGMVEAIVRVLNNTGEVLRRGAYQSLGTFVIDCAKKSNVDGRVSGSRFVHRIVEAIPGFRDMAMVAGEPVYLLKKVQLLAMDLHSRFSRSNPELFHFYDIEEIPIFSDNVIPTVLNHLKIITLSVKTDTTPRQTDIIQGLQEDLRTGRETTTERSYIFRAAAVDACEIIVQIAREMPNTKDFIRKMTANQIDAYLWQIAKQGSTRDVIRFCDPNTIYF